DPQVLFNLFLPPIIFHGAYTLNQKRFMRNLGSVLTFAFLGTLISCLIIGACVYGFTRLMVMLGQAADGDFFLTDCLLFGAIISATDPVVDLLTELSVDLDLHTLLFGESVLNDAMAIVLTHSITTYSQMGPGHSFDPLAFFISVGYFLGVLAGSFILGFTFTLCENPLLQTSVFFLLSWSSFLSAEAIGLSGIVAVLFCGLSQARYTVHNLSSEGRTRTKQLYEVFNFLGEIFLFGYMGYVLLTFPHHVFKVLFIFGAFVSFSAKRPSIFTLLHTYLLSGLRGAVAFNLAARDTSTEARRTILTTTLLLVSFTIWVLGTAADPVLRCLDIRSDFMVKEPMAHNDESRQWSYKRNSMLHLSAYLFIIWTLPFVDSVEYEEELSLFRASHTAWCHRYVMPLLTHYGPPQTNSLPQWCGVFAGLCSSPDLQQDNDQLSQTVLHVSNLDLEKTEIQLVSVGGDSGSEHQEDLLEGDLGLGAEAPGITSSPSLSASAPLRLRNPPPTVIGVTGQGN
uniref:Cation/H+ exchanger transmembrane domain-containing protein n=1 Tax=Mola mola TaxID=94237 RepID=A0A3Q3WDX4_MOLML